MIQVSPPNIQILKSKDKNAWNARDVADCVLADKSALVSWIFFFHIWISENFWPKFDDIIFIFIYSYSVSPLLNV